MKLETKHLAPYLPYGLNMMYDFKNGNVWKLDITNINAITEYDKPILRPLSDLTDRINPVQHHTYLDGLNHNSIEKIKDLIIKGTLYLEDYNYLIEYHFDVFGLIEKGLAIDINNFVTNENINIWL